MIILDLSFPFFEFKNEEDIHVNSVNYEKNGYGLIGVWID